MKAIEGTVISDKMNQTVVVEMVWYSAHPLYHKQMRHARKFHAHNTVGAKVGDKVRIVEIKPMSKTKTWQVEAVI